jgi:hypothetical protein
MICRWLVIADPYESAQGVLSLRAFRMTKVFSRLLKQQDGFSPEKYVFIAPCLLLARAGATY